MDLFQIALRARECFATLALAEIGKIAERRAWFATLDKFGVLRDVPEVFVVAKPTVAEEVVDLVGSEALEGVGPVWGIAAADIRRGCGGVSAKREECSLVNACRLELGTTAERDGGVGLVFAGFSLRRLVN